MNRLRGLILLGIAVFVFTVVQRNFRTAAASRTWPTADGIIVRCEEVTRSPRPGRSPKRTVEVEYTYRLAEVEYRSDQVTAGNIGGSSAYLLRKYPRGTQVPVRYNPDDPAQAVLEPGVPGGAVWLYSIPVVLAIVGLFRVIIPGRGR